VPIQMLGAVIVVTGLFFAIRGQMVRKKVTP